MWALARRPIEGQPASVRTLAVDLQDREATAAAIPEGSAVVHLAYWREGGAEGNLRMASSLAAACRVRGAERLVHVSTAVVAGRAPGEWVTEATPCRPADAYQRTKLRIEEELRLACAGATPLVILRPSAILGWGGATLRSLTRQLLHGSRLGNALRSALYARRPMHLVPVETVVAAVEHFLLRPALAGPDLFLVTDDEAPENTYRELERRLLRALGRRPRRPEPPALPLWCLSVLLALTGRNVLTTGMRFSSALLRATGFGPPVDLADAIDAYGRRAAEEPPPPRPADSRGPGPRGRVRPELAVVGTLVPEGGEFDSTSVSLAGQRFQRHALRALADAGLPADLVLSMRPIAAFPRERRLWLGGGRHDTGGIAVRVLPTLNVQPIKSLLAGLVAFGELVAWGRRLPPAVSRVVLSFNLSDPPGVFAWAAARLVQAQYVGWVLDLHEPGGLVADSWSRRLDFAMERRLIPRLDGLVVVADRIAQDFAPGKRYLRIESGVDPEAFLEPPPPRPVGAEPFTLVLAGTLASFNGVELALDAFALLPGDGWRLTIAGGGRLEPLVRRRAAGDPRIGYAGVLPFDELISLYRQSDLLLNLRPTIALRTQYYFPSKLLELIASGTPVVSTCTGHVETELAGRVFLLREETPEALAELLRRLRALDPEARLAVGRAGREHVLTEKTWRAQAERLADFLRDVARQPAGRAGSSASGAP